MWWGDGLSGGLYGTAGDIWVEVMVCVDGLPVLGASDR